MHESMDCISPPTANHNKNRGAYLTELSVLQTHWEMYAISDVSSTIFHMLTNHAGYMYSMQHQPKKLSSLENWKDNLTVVPKHTVLGEMGISRHNHFPCSVSTLVHGQWWTSKLKHWRCGTVLNGQGAVIDENGAKVKWKLAKIQSKVWSNTTLSTTNLN